MIRATSMQSPVRPGDTFLAKAKCTHGSFSLPFGYPCMRALVPASCMGPNADGRDAFRATSVKLPCNFRAAKHYGYAAELARWRGGPDSEAAAALAAE
jgi:hypothetical protein